jgi:hypothetical protein
VHPRRFRLQNATAEIHNVLVFVWSKVLAVDASCRKELLDVGGHRFFIDYLSSRRRHVGSAAVPGINLGAPATHNPAVHVPPLAQSQASQPPGGGDGFGTVADGCDVPEDETVEALFVLATLVDGTPAAQRACLDCGVLRVLELLLRDDSDDVRMWACVALAKLCAGCPAAVDAVMVHVPVGKHHGSGGTPVGPAHVDASFSLGMPLDSPFLTSAATPHLSALAGDGGNTEPLIMMLHRLQYHTNADVRACACYALSSLISGPRKEGCVVVLRCSFAVRMGVASAVMVLYCRCVLHTVARRCFML